MKIPRLRIRKNTKGTLAGILIAVGSIYVLSISYDIPRETLLGFLFAFTAARGGLPQWLLRLIDAAHDALLEETAKSQQLGSVDELMAAYKERGFAEDQVRSDARKQVLMTAAIEEIDVPKPTEAELRKLDDQAAAAQPPSEGGGGEASGAEGAPAETPAFEDLKPQLEQQVTAQKQNEAIMERMEELRKDADVEITL